MPVSQWANSSTLMRPSVVREFRRNVRNSSRNFSDAAISLSSRFSSSLSTIESLPQLSKFLLKIKRLVKSFGLFPAKGQSTPSSEGKD
jgi:hypothetical protein